MSFAYDDSTKILTQTGRDADLSGIAGTAWGSGTTYTQGTLVNYNEKVYQATVQVASGGSDPSSNSDWLDTGIKYIVQKQGGNQGLYTYDVPSDIRMNVRGTLFHDPEEEILILRHDYPGSGGEILALNIADGNTDSNFIWQNTGSGFGFARDSQNRIVLTDFSDHGYEVGDALKIRNMARVVDGVDQITVNGQNPPVNNQAHGWYRDKVLPVVEVTSDTVTLGMTEYSEGVPTGGGVLRKPAYNYGKVITEPSGRTRTSRGCGLFINGDNLNNFNGSGGAIGTDGSGGFMMCRGGTICISRPLDIVQLGFDWIDTNIFSISNMESRGMSGGGRLRNVKLINYNFQGIDHYQIWERGLVLEDGHLMEVYAEDFKEIELLNFDATGNVNGTDIGHAKSSQFYHRDWVAINSASGSSVKGMWRDTTNQPSQMGNVFVVKEVSFNFKDTSAQAIGGVKVYAQDNPSDYAKKVTYPVPTQNGYDYTETTYTAKQKGNTLGVLNSDGTVTYDYTNPITYLKTADANGDVEKFRVTTGAQMLEYSVSDSNAIFPNTTLPSGVTENRYHGEFGYTIPGMSNGQWSDDGAGNTAQGWNGQAQYSHWDTDLFGGFYKVDRRGNNNTDEDEFTFYFASYGHSLSSSTQALKGVGELAVKWVLFNDSSITQSSKASVDLYDEINTPQKFYDKAKAYLVDNYAGETSTIVTRSGNEVDAGSYNVHINKNLTDSDGNDIVFAFDGTTITIKTDQFIGDIVTTGTTTVESDEVVVGNFGSIGVLPWEIKNIEATSRIQLYNVTQDAEVLTTKLTGTAGTLVDTDGTYTSGEIAVGDVVRLRVTCVVGATAMLPLEVTGVATTAGLNFSIDQQADTIYNINGIDGSAISAWTADFTNNPMGVDLSESDGGATVQEIYAFMVYSQTTADGVDKWFNVVTAIDGSNYQIDDTVANIKIQNIGTVAVNISGGRIFRKDGASVLYAEQGNYPLTLDTGALVANIQPQMETVINNNSKISSIDNNSKLIPGLL